MISSLKLGNIRNNIYFVANIMIISNLVNYSLMGTSLFDNEWLYSSFGILIAYIFYSLVSDKLISFNDEDYIRKKSKEDAIKYIVIYTLAHFLVNFFNKGFVELSITWGIRTFITIGSYIYFDYIFSDLFLKFNYYEILFFDLIKIFMAEIIGVYIIYHELVIVEMAELIAYAFSYIVWKLGTKVAFSIY